MRRVEHRDAASSCVLRCCTDRQPDLSPSVLTPSTTIASRRPPTSLECGPARLKEMAAGLPPVDAVAIAAEARTELESRPHP
jgi:hypothetical protein